MKSIALIAAGLAALVGGCTSVPRNAANDSYDAEKVAAVNSVARSRGIVVQWVNYPQRKTSAPVTAPAVAPGGT